MWMANYHTSAKHRSHRAHAPTCCAHGASSGERSCGFRQAWSLELGGDFLGQGLERIVESVTQKRKQFYETITPTPPHLVPQSLYLFPTRKSSAYTYMPQRTGSSLSVEETPAVSGRT